jgi:hypothetical protein
MSSGDGSAVARQAGTVGIKTAAQYCTHGDFFDSFSLGLQLLQILDSLK